MMHDKSEQQNGSAAPTCSKPGPFPFENNPNCERVLQMFSLFSNEFRFKILCILSQGDYCVQDMVDALGAKYSNISQQLKMLTLAGYISKRREQKQIFYHLESPDIRDILDFLKSRYAGEEE